MFTRSHPGKNDQTGISAFDFVKGALWFLRLPLLPCFIVYILKPQNRNQQNRLINQELF